LVTWTMPAAVNWPQKDVKSANPRREECQPYRWLVGSSISMRWRRWEPPSAESASAMTSAHCCTCSVTVCGSGRRVAAEAAWRR
jgi:hypothetical protein